MPKASPESANVFPAYAGMFHAVGLFDSLSLGFPRIRGDVPAVFEKLDFVPEFSPHTRGCS